MDYFTPRNLREAHSPSRQVAKAMNNHQMGTVAAVEARLGPPTDDGGPRSSTRLAIGASSDSTLATDRTTGAYATLDAARVHHAR